MSLTVPARIPTVDSSVTSLYSGDRLAACELLRRFETVPQLKKAELIEEIGFMDSPVSFRHAKLDPCRAGRRAGIHGLGFAVSARGFQLAGDNGVKRGRMRGALFEIRL